MPILRLLTLDAEETPVSGARVVARIMSSAKNPAYMDGGGTIMQSVQKFSDEVGLVTFDLPSNEVLTPAGTYWRIEEYPTGSTRPKITDVSLPNALAEYDIEDVRVDAPSSPTPTYLTAQQLANHAESLLNHDDVAPDPEPGTFLMATEDGFEFVESVATEIEAAGLVESHRAEDIHTEPQPPIIGPGATQAVAGNDARLNDARTPTAHEHPFSDISGVAADAQIPGTIARTSALDAEEDARVAADDTLTADLTTETTSRQDADATLQANIDAEATTRADADTKAAHDALGIDAGTVDGFEATLLGVPDLDRTTKYRSIFAGIRAEIAIASLRVDDNDIFDYTRTSGTEGMYELARSRFLPLGFAVNPGTIGQTNRMTAAQLREVAYGVSATSTGGHEPIDHSATHGDDPANLAFIAETETSLAAIRAMDVSCDSFAQPGSWDGEHNYNTAAKMDNPYGRRLRATYAGVNAYAYMPSSTSGWVHEFPMQQRYGTGHVTISDITDVNTITAAIDGAIRRKGYLAMVLHSRDIGGAGKLSMANLKVVLDYLKARVDEGKLRVLTPTAALYCERGTPENLVFDGGFEQQPTGAWSNSTGIGWFNGTGGAGSGGTPTISAGTGRNGTKSLQISNGNNLEQAFPARNIRRALLTAYARTLTPGTPATARIIWRVYDAAGTQLISHSMTWSVGDSYTKSQALVGVPPNGERVHLWLLHLNNATPNYEIDDVSLVKV